MTNVCLEIHNLNIQAGSQPLAKSDRIRWLRVVRVQSPRLLSFPKLLSGATVSNVDHLAVAT